MTNPTTRPNKRSQIYTIKIRLRLCVRVCVCVHGEFMTTENIEINTKYSLYFSCFQWGPHGEMVKAMDCRIVVSEFVLQLLYYVHFRANTPYPPSYGLNCTTTVLLGEWV